MSDWDFLHDMHDKGYSAAEISDAAAIGYAPWQSPDFDDDIKISPEEEHQLKLSALDSLERLLQAGEISQKQFRQCKADILR